MGSRAPFRSGLPIHVSGVQHTIRSIRRKGQSRKATCLDNACIESFFSHLKTEKIYLNQCNSEVEIRQAVEDYMYNYNYRRFQAKLKQRAPIEYRCALTA
ncbi:IS3 family transposase [Paenibacillus sp. BIC5C1]|uniref:IS3 family transposase n=1 Tax=Paenibacillus sp. BIC5C1 TaxID=3078263 RepID=UPI0037C556F1